MKYYEVNGFYGSQNTPTNVLVAENYRGEKYYVAEGGTIVNQTEEEIKNGVNIEELVDFDCLTVSEPIYTLEELEQAIEA